MNVNPLGGSKSNYFLISSSSCRAANMDLPDPLLPVFPIIHCTWLVF